MRVHVISDMEGVAGIVKWEQTTGGEQLYEEGRKLYTEEINATIRGAKAAGATEIVVMDCHGAGKGWTFNSLSRSELLGDGLTTVAVKRGFGAFGARIIPPVRAREMIEGGAKRALSDLSAVPPWDPGRPAEIRVEYKNTTAPDHLHFRAGVERADDRTIVSRAATWWEARKQFYF